MGQYKTVDPKNEAELEQLIINNPEAVEAGFKVLTNQQTNAYGRRIDILGVDESGAVCVFEIKNEENDEAFDQVLDGFAWVNENRESLARNFPDKGIKVDRTPRIILIAPSFSDRIRRRVGYLRDDINVNLSVFKIIEHEGEKLPVLNEIPPILVAPLMRAQPTLEALLGYIQSERGKKLYKEAVDYSRDVSRGGKESLTGSYIAFGYKDTPLLVGLTVKRSGFTAWLREGHEYINVSVTDEDEWARVKEEIRKTFAARGGTKET